MIDTPAIEKLLGELEALHEKATPGPWEYLVDGDWPMIYSAAHDEDGHRLCVVDLFHGGYDYEDLGHSLKANGELMAAAVSAIPTLITTIRALMESVDLYEGELRLAMWNRLAGEGVKQDEALRQIKAKAAAIKALSSNPVDDNIPADPASIRSKGDA